MTRPDLGKYPLSQSFNDICCRATYAQFGYKGHNGLDIAIPCGKPLYASHSGKAYLYSDPNGYGLAVFITGGGYESITAHMSRRIVQTGQLVKEKQLIGYSGTTGFSTACHCHFGLRPIPYNSNNGFGGYINPTPLLKEEEVIDRALSIWLWRTVKLVHSPSDAKINSIIGKDPVKVLEDWYDDGDTLEYRSIIRNKYPDALAKITELQKDGTTLAPGKYIVK